VVYHNNFGEEDKTIRVGLSYTTDNYQFLDEEGLTIEDEEEQVSLARTGYTLLGWSTSKYGAVNYDAGSDLYQPLTRTSKDVHLYAVWQANKYTITFDANKPEATSGTVTGTMKTESMVYDTEKSLYENTYELEGYTFLGWDEDKDAQTATYRNMAMVENLTSDKNGQVTLYAIWQANTFEVAFDANVPADATSKVAGTMANQTFTYDQAQNLTENAYILTGYTFKGWSLDKEATAEDTTALMADASSQVNLATGGEKTIYAVWKKNTYNVEFHANVPRTATSTAQGRMDAQTMTYDVEAALTANAYTLEGYTFRGWSTDEAVNEVTYTDKKKVVNLSTQGTFDLYAFWQANSYEVAFDANVPADATSEATGTMANQTCTYDVAQNLTKNAYTLTGYTFLGWSLDENATGEDTTALMADESEQMNLATSGVKTLYAIWAKNEYTVSFDANKPEGATTNVQGTMAVQTMTYDVEAALTENAYTLEGYTFEGWSKDAKAAEASYTDKQQLKNLSSQGACTLYAIWQANSYEVAFDANVPATATSEVSGAMENQTFAYDKKQKLTKNAYTLTGYTFLGWSLDENATGEDTTALMADESEQVNFVTSGVKTLYAIWQANTYEVAFDSDVPETATSKVSGTMENQTFTYDKKQKLTKNAYTLTGYTFLGWALDKDASQDSEQTATDSDAQPADSVLLADESEQVNLATDGVKTVYAVWEKNGYVVSFDANVPEDAKSQAEGTMDDQSFTYDETQKLTKNAYTLSGYTFIGWSVDAKATEATYTDEQSVSNVGSENVVKLYAIWKAVDYQVTFDGNGFAVTIEAQNIHYGYPAKEPVAPTADGQRFDGWYQDQACTQAWDFEKDVVTQDIVLYAKWYTLKMAVTDTEGNKTYFDTLVQALEYAETLDTPVQIDMSKSQTISSDMTIPENVTLNLDKNTIKVSDGVVLTNQGSIVGTTGAISGTGSFVNNSQVDTVTLRVSVVQNENGTIANSTISKQTKVTGGVLDSVTNSGSIFGSTLSGNSVNRGTIQDAVVTGNLDNKAVIQDSDTSAAVVAGKTEVVTLESATKNITATDTDKAEVKGSTYRVLQLKGTGKNKAVSLSWKKQSKASGYIVYGAACGGKMKKLAELKSKSKNKYTHTKLKKGKYYKYMVVAYTTVKGQKQVLAMSKIVHVATLGGKKGNATGLKVTQKSVNVKKGKTVQLKATMVKKQAVQKHLAYIRYESANPKIATVSSKGKIKGVKKGKTTIYVYTQNGISKQVKVTVK
ncbi:MAG: InlB B-repeat-containing protein, partial [Wujia sp.]